LHLGRACRDQASAVHGDGGGNPQQSPIRTFYLRLRAGGKHAKPALTACMRKLLVILNAMLRTNTHWKISAFATTSSVVSPLVGAVSEHGCC
jgi:hypothetical protein